MSKAKAVPGIEPGVTLIAGRYRVEQVMGHGGTAAVFRVRDESTGKVLALKQLQLEVEDKKKAKLRALFEREYHTLTHLAHPSVIEVYDYGVDNDRPYYTMELLEGGDLWDGAPVPWRKACAMLRDVCSSLALLHARRLIHRDISPRNVRITAEGRAKLIDFGSLAVMGMSKDIVGTPSFIAPEVIIGLTLDGRTDLYSLGSLAYWTLIRRRAYPARYLSELKDVWRSRPMELIVLVPEVPEALNTLVMSLLSLDPLARPSSAAEVIERLTAIGQLPANETLGVAQAYLTTPTSVAREEALLRFRKQVLRAVGGTGSSIMVEGKAGLGRSRLLAGFVLEGKLAGATVLQASGEDGKQGDFGVIKTLAGDLMRALPDPALDAARKHVELLGQVIPEIYQRLSYPPEPPKMKLPDRFGYGEHAVALVQSAMTNWLLAVARERCLMLAVDDVHLCDVPSSAVLATLAYEAPQHKVVVAVTADLEARARVPKAVEVLRQAGARVKLRPLEPEGTERLLRSVFGEVPNIKMVSEWVHELAQGNPRTSMELAQHLVNQGIAVYRGGVWILPESLRDQSLPRSMEQALDARIAVLSEPALALAQAFSLVTYYAPLKLADQIALFSADYTNQQIFGALEELVAAQILIGSEDRYNFKQRVLAEAVRRSLTEERRRALHLKLADLYAADGSYSELITAYHYQQAGVDDKAVDLALATSSTTRMSDPVYRSAYGIRVFEEALRYAEQHGRSAVDLYRLGKALVQISAFVDPLLVRYADKVAERLRNDSGLCFWEQTDPNLEPSERIGRCLQMAQERYDQTPEAERGLRPPSAVKEMAVCAVMMSSAYGRTLDMDKLNMLPTLLEPFRTLLPVLDLIYQIVSVIADQTAQRPTLERRRVLAERLQQPVPDLDDVSREGILFVFTYYLALDEAILGKPSGFYHAELLVRHPNYAALGWQVRMLTHLFRGENRQAVECRERMELLAIHQDVENDLHLATGLLYEAGIYAFTGDLLELKRVMDFIEEFAEKHPGWRPHLLSCRGAYHWMRGELAQARAELEQALSMVEAGGHSVWWITVMRYVYLLLEQGEYERVKSVGKDVLDKCEKGQVEYLYLRYIGVSIALAEARLGEYSQAIERLDRFFEEVRTNGIEGVHVGYGYEVRARIAIWQGDLAAFQKYAKLTAEVYLPIKSGNFAAKYRNLMEEARQAWISVSSEIEAIGGASKETATDSTLPLETAAIRSELDMCRGPELRAQRVLGLLMGYSGATDGYLYGMLKQGLSLVAAYEGSAPPTGMEDAVNGRLSAELEEQDTVSVISEVDTDQELEEQRFTDSRGQVYQLVVLFNRQEGRTFFTGVAALGRPADKRLRMPSSEFVSALSEGMLSAGDVTAAVIR